MRVLLVDDHALFRGALASLLSSARDIEVVGEVGNGEQALAAAKKLSPDIVLMDLRMPVYNGVDATRRIKQELPQIKVVALTVSEEVNDLVQIIKNGADGYLLKGATPDELVAGLWQVMRGEAALSPSMASKILAEFAQDPRGRGESPRAALSPRELAILKLVGRGASNKEIGDQLRLNESTVRNHLHHILEKLHLRNRVQAAIFAATHGLLPDRGQGGGS